ncbi:MAG: hypothetical protein ACRDMV_03825, partial [Streptosporangiales bacterium]
ASRWLHGDHLKMLHRSAALVARLCDKYDIPVRHIGPAELRAGKRGICGHIDVTRAWHQTTHTDPAGFPWNRFLKMVRAGGAVGEDDMDRVSLAIGKPVALHDTVTTVGFDEKFGKVPGWKPGHPSLLRGPCDYQVGYIGTVEQLPAGAEVDVEIVEPVKDGKGWKIGNPVGAVPPLVAGKDGTVNFNITSLPGGHMPKDGRVWLRLHCHGVKGAMLTRCVAQGWYQ